MAERFRLFTDAGSRGNPGNAAYGVFIYDKNNKLIDFHGKYIGVLTNNQAEFSGLIAGLELGLKNKITEIDCYSDSNLMVNQVNGLFQIKDASLKVKVDKIRDLMKRYKSATLTYIEREKNSIADKMVNIILDAKVA